MEKRNLKNIRKLIRKFPSADHDRKLKQLSESSKPLSIYLTNDFAFKKTFRNKTALTGLLSSLLDLPPEEIVDLEFPDTFLHGDFLENHEGILDVKVHLNHCRKINIEIQLLAHSHWEERSLFYLSRMYAEDFIKGQSYGDMEECIHISILGFPLEGAKHLYSVIHLKDERTNRIYSSKLSLRVLYLNKLDTCSEEDRCTEIYHWAKLITARDWRVLKEMAKRNKYMKEAVEEMERLNADKDLRYLYLMRLKAASDEATMREYYDNIEKNALEIHRNMGATMRDLDSTKKSLDSTKKDLDSTKKSLDTTKKNLDSTKKDLDSTKNELIATEKALDAARKELETQRCEGFRKGQESGIRILIEDGLEDGRSREEIIRKLQKRFNLDEGMACAYLESYSDRL